MNSKEALSHLTAADPILARIISEVGAFNPRPGEPTFETLARAIVFQQLAGKAALAIWNRLLARAGSPLKPEAALKLRTPTLRKIGLSRQKAGYLRDLAQRTVEREIDFAALDSLTDDEVIVALTRVKGIGVWTAHMFLMFALRRPNVLPVGDFGIRNAMRKHYRMRKLPDPKRMHKIARSWHPYCSVACWYLWRSLDVKPPASEAEKLDIEK